MEVENVEVVDAKIVDGKFQYTLAVCLKDGRHWEMYPTCDVPIQEWDRVIKGRE